MSDSPPDASSPAQDDTLLEWLALDEDEGERADVVLGRHLPSLSRRIARTLGLQGRLRIDGRKAKPSLRVLAGQKLELRVSVDAAPIAPLIVLHESAQIIFVHKPPGVHTVALRPGERSSLSAQVVAAFPECEAASEDPREGGALHRLDQATSGVVAFARTREAWQQGRKAFAEAEVVKDYVARSAQPWPPRLPEEALITWLDEAEPIDRPAHWPARSQDASCWRIRAALGPAESRAQVRVRMDGRRATTFVEWLADSPTGGSLVHVRLATGHRHQARVHMAWCGLPLWGDEFYGPGSGERLGLHAFALDLSASFPELPRVEDPHDLNAWAPGLALIAS